jgi:maltooligosyltrehalose trehalohydrolase
MLGERLSALINFEGLKLAAGIVFLSPYIPLLFMGEEYGEVSPFLYFIDHSDLELIRAIREGRKNEFRSFAWHREPPDPQDIETYLACKLTWKNRSVGKHNVLLKFYRQLIILKKKLPALRCDENNVKSMISNEDNKIVVIERVALGCSTLGIINFNEKQSLADVVVTTGVWKKLLDSSASKWMGPGTLLSDVLSQTGTYSIPPLSFSLYERSQPE